MSVARGPGWPMEVGLAVYNSDSIEGNNKIKWRQLGQPF